MTLCCAPTAAELIAVCVMDILLGGGSAFSAGGPGKGMYSRLYRVCACAALCRCPSVELCRALLLYLVLLVQEVLNVHHWVEAANAFSIQFAHQGLFGIYGSSTPERAPSLLNVLCSHIMKLAGTGTCAACLLVPWLPSLFVRVVPARPVARDELERARNQLSSSVRMNLELRAILCEDIGRQVRMLFCCDCCASQRPHALVATRQMVGIGKRIPPDELCAKIAAVSQQDIQRVAQKAVKSPPAFAAYGDCSHLPEYHLVKEFFAGM